MDVRTQLDSLKVKVVIVAFFDRQLAQYWLDNPPHSKFQFVLDPERKLYHYCGQYRSAELSLHYRALTWYACEISKGRETVKPVKSDDIYQVGGDCIVSRDGVLKYVFTPSTSAFSERPTLNSLLNILDSK